MTRSRRFQAGVGMVEFAIVAPFLFLVIFGIVDFSRVIHIQSSIAQAARQGARQAAANAKTADQPFTGSPGGQCSGVVFTQNQAAGTTGCLTDAGIKQTVQAGLNEVVAAADIEWHTSDPTHSYTSTNCPAPSANGKASVCIWPAQSSVSPASGLTSCATAVTQLGRAPQPGDNLGSRAEEWNSPAFQGCYLVQVTVIYRYQPWTPVIGRLIPAFTLQSSTATIAEY